MFAESWGQVLTCPLTLTVLFSQQMSIFQTSSLGQLTVPSMVSIEINDSYTLTIARTYLDVLEKKMKEPKKELEKFENIEEEPQSD